MMPNAKRVEARFHVSKDQRSRKASSFTRCPRVNKASIPVVFTATSKHGDRELDSKWHPIPHKAAGIFGTVHQQSDYSQLQSAAVTPVSSWSSIATTG